MTACAIETAVDHGTESPGAFTITADGSYAARLAPCRDEAGGRLPERWTLNGPEPYVVRLPGDRPEEPGSEVLPLADGRVLIHRSKDERQLFSLLYPTGPGTGEVPLGGLECERLTLLPPAPDGQRAYALAHHGSKRSGAGAESTGLWMVHGGGGGPEHIAELPGHCTGGVWLDRTGQLLAVDQEIDGRTKTVTVDLYRRGELSPLLQIAEKSDDRLLMADPESGLLIVRSNAPGDDRLGWGVLGSSLPVRFPRSLEFTGRPEQAAAVTPFAIQPERPLTPESCAVALRIGGPDCRRVGVWRPAEGRLRQFTAPEGWLPGAGLWTAEGELRLPYTTAEVPCGLARATAVRDAPERAEDPRPATGGGRPAPSPRSSPRPFVRFPASFQPRSPRSPRSSAPLFTPRVPMKPSAEPPRAEGRERLRAEREEAAEPSAPPAGPVVPHHPMPLQQAPLDTPATPVESAGA
ncbi:hypothetical protein [Streptomyces sp. TP-A0874]|uniref:hypothetical protein n=1 Tax=Streptomyces sp. TP-A0874 TaxID=549819 RepID=UPI000852DCD4|nr:hypothetical protein [Streptomyces sp. TP-A0874]